MAVLEGLSTCVSLSPAVLEGTACTELALRKLQADEHSSQYSGHSGVDCVIWADMFSSLAGHGDDGGCYPVFRASNVFFVDALLVDG